MNVTKGKNYTTMITIDETVGRDTTILLMGSGVDFSAATVSGPGNSLLTTGPCSDSCSLKINGLAEVTNNLVIYILLMKKNLPICVSIYLYIYLFLSIHPSVYI